MYLTSKSANYDSIVPKSEILDVIDGVLSLSFTLGAAVIVFGLI